MKGLIISSFFFIIVSFSFSQQGDGGEPKSNFFLPNNNLSFITENFQQPNIQLLRSQDANNDSLNDFPWRFGYNYSSNLTLENAGGWIETKKGGKIWFLQLVCKKAKTINLTFNNSFLPEGNELYVYNSSKDFILGKFTQKHFYKGTLGTELIPGDTLIVEYYVPKGNKLGTLEISRVTYGYRSAKEFQQRAFGSSQSCQVNVNCPDGQPYINQRNSVVLLLVNGNSFCTGSLINNTQYDGTPYVLTANHCYSSDEASWVFRFQWQAQNCSNPATSPSFQSLSGSVLRARRTASDFCLVEITGGLTNGQIPAPYTPYFSGWNRKNDPPSSTVSIHHPNGDIKKISFDDDSPFSTQVTIGNNTSDPNGVWYVEWDRHTATEGGSSGAPLFNDKGQIIGQLWGGNSSCATSGLGGHDYYGRIHTSWNPSGSPITEELKHWLDPTNTEDEQTQGYDPYATVYTYDIKIIDVIGIKNNQCGFSTSPSVILINNGSTTLTSATLLYTYNSVTKSILWTGNLATHESTKFSLPSINFKDGNNTISIEVNAPNGQQDEDTSNNNYSKTFQVNTGKVNLKFDFYLGCFSSEVSWEIKNEIGDIIYSGTNYPAPTNTNFLVSDDFCFTNGCYELILKDSYGDGVYGFTYGGCDYNGSMTLIQVGDGDTLAYLPESEANFGHQIAFPFCITKGKSPKVNQNGSVHLYPNPSHGKTSLKMNFKGAKTIYLFNSIGQRVKEYHTSDTTININVPHLSSGVYFVMIRSEVKNVIKKMIVY